MPFQTFVTVVYGVRHRSTERGTTVAKEAKTVQKDIFRTNISIPA